MPEHWETEDFKAPPETNFPWIVWADGEALAGFKHKTDTEHFVKVCKRAAMTVEVKRA